MIYMKISEDVEDLPYK